MLAERIGRTLESKGLTLAVAESCTGGKLGDAVTEVPGSSSYFLGGVISYSNDAKKELLGVSSETLESKGAVSEEVAIQMARAVRGLFGADIGVGITGIAGPSGGTPQKPVGLVYIAVASASRTACTRSVFDGPRPEVKSRSVAKAIEMLEGFLG